MSEIVGSAEVEVFADTKAFERGVAKGAQKAGKQAGGIFRSSFTKNVAAVTGGFLAAGGIERGFRSLVNLGKDSVKAAASQSAANALVARSVKNAKAEMDIYGQSIEATLEAESRITGIADDELAPAFTRLVQVTHDSTEAFRLLQLAEDVSRQRKIGVAQAALSLAKAQGGQLTALKRIIPGLKAESKELSKQENIRRALGQVQTQFGGSRIAFAESDAGSLERFNVAMDELKETLGTEILPGLADAAKKTADFIGKPETQQQAKSFFAGISSAVKDTVTVLKAGAQGIGDSLTFKEARIGADNIARLAGAVQSLSSRLETLDKGQQARTRELIKFQQLNELEGLRGHRNLDAKPAAQGDVTVALKNFSTINASLTSKIKEAQALATKTTGDDLKFYRTRRENIDKQIAGLNDGVLRGKNDQDRLLRLYDEQERIQDGITSIEEEANSSRQEAIDERNRLREEDRQKALEDKQAAIQEAKDAKERARSLKESRLSLRLQKAELAGSNEAQKTVLRAQVKYYAAQAAGFRKTRAFARAIEAESNKVAAQLALKGLKTGGRSKTAASGGRFDFFGEAASNFRQFGSNIAGRGGVLSGQDARGALAGLALERKANTQNLMQQTVVKQLQESQVTNTILRSIKDVLQGTSKASGSQPPQRVSAAARTARRYATRYGGPT